MEHQLLDSALHTFLIKLFELSVKLILLTAGDEQSVLKDRVLMSLSGTSSTEEETSFSVLD